jgi:hypothetical protein
MLLYKWPFSSWDFFWWWAVVWGLRSSNGARYRFDIEHICWSCSSTKGRSLRSFVHFLSVQVQVLNRCELVPILSVFSILWLSEQHLIYNYSWVSMNVSHKAAASLQTTLIYYSNFMFFIFFVLPPTIACYFVSFDSCILLWGSLIRYQIPISSCLEVCILLCVSVNG